MDGASSTESVQLMRSLLAAARHKSTDLLAQLHPAWVKMACQRIGCRASPPGSADGQVRWSSVFAGIYGLRWTSLAAFRHRAHRIALLPRPDMMQLLSAIALHADRERVRRCIGRTMRAALVERIGEAAYAALLDAPPRPGTNDNALTEQELHADRLAASGYAVLSARHAWRCRHTLAWVRLALPPSRGRAEPDNAADSDPVLDRLPTFFPEHAWLFGSHMDRALSA